jgi:predicted hydrocarbon binding protein
MTSMTAKIKHKIAKRESHKKRADHTYEHAYESQGRHTTYEAALLKPIIGGTAGGRVSRHAYMLYSLIANTTPSLRALSYRHGIAAGRSLYQLCSQSKRYMLYEESVHDLVSFFERAGFGRITYRAFPDNISIGMHDTLHMDLGMSTHAFEAGMISGFLTASKGQLMSVTERACSSNAEDNCEFCVSNDPESISKPEIGAAFGRFIEDTSMHVLNPEASNAGIVDEYYALSSLVLLDKKYFSEIRSIAGYLGSRLASELGVEAMPPSRALEAFEKTVDLLNLGITKVKTSGKFDITLRFDKLHSRKEFADLSVAFIHGFLGRATKGAAMNAKCLINNGTYTVRLIMAKRRTKSQKN